MYLKEEEKLLSGKWIFKDGKIEEDSVSKRINWLKDNYLIKIGRDKTGWEILYKDPNDGRYWELIYENSELQGGGAPTLSFISKEEAVLKYNITDMD